jgi:hypothetical protein
MKHLLWIAALIAAPLFAQNIKPTPPAQTVVTQSTTGQRAILRRPAAFTIQEDASGRFAVTDGTTAFVFRNANDLTVHLQGSLPKCAKLPPHVTREIQCPNNFTGHWTQTEIFQPAPYPACWIETTPPSWSPDRPPENACTPIPPPTFQWQAPFDVHNQPVPARPAKNGTYTTPYGALVQRVTDYAAELPGAQWVVSWYNRFQALNSDGTLVVFYESDGFWDLYDAHTNAFLRHLNGPAGDAEFNWDVSNPRLAYYVPTNGGTSIRQIDVVANTNTLYYDFTAAAHALWPDAVHFWTKSEGRTSADGRYIGFQGETAQWVTRGWIKVDLVAKAIVWSKTNTTGDRPDNTSISPNGRWLIASFGSPLGTWAYDTTGNASCQLHTTVEHAALGKLSNGHDAFLYPNYTSGNVEAKDVDTCTRLDTSWPAPVKIYNNPWLFNNGNCVSCAMHPSFNAYRKPGWALIGFYGPYAAGLTPPANTIVLNVETGRVYGLSASYAQDLGYWDEAHCTTDIDFTVAFCTENWLSPNKDVIKITIPALP